MKDKVQLTKEQVKYVSNLVRIYISEKNLENYKDQLAGVLSYLEIFKELNTKNVPITSQVTGLTNIFRKDKVETRALSQDDVFANTKNKKNGYFIVKRFISK